MFLEVKTCWCILISSVTQSCLFVTAWTAARQASLSIINQLPELTQTDGHRVGDAIQPSHPLSSTSPPTFNLSQYQGLFTWVSFSHQVAKVLELQLQHQSFQGIFRSIQGSLFPTISLFHQEASINLLSLSIRGQTEWKSKSQKKLIKLITWTTALYNSKKPSAMPCRATQDRWVMVESSDKTWSTGEGMANHFNMLALRIPWTVWKGKKIGHWKMNSPGW